MKEIFRKYSSVS